VSLRVLLLIVASVLCSAAAQLVLKKGMTGVAATSGHGLLDKLHAVMNVLLNPWIIGGFALYGLGALVWLLVLARVDVSLAYPFVALGFVVTAALGYLLLGEPMTTAKIAGIALVTAGVVVLARG